MDFLGLGKSLVDRETDISMEAERCKLVKPIPSIPEKLGLGAMSRSVHLSESERASERESSISRLRQGVLPSLSGKAWGGRDEEMEGGVTTKSSEKPSLEKPLEELTDADIMQLTREDCRRYLKEKGMQRPPWNKQQAIQQVFSLRGLSDPRSEEMKVAGKAGGLSPKRESNEAPMHMNSPSLSAWEHPTASPATAAVSKDGRPSHEWIHEAAQANFKALYANGFQAPRMVQNSASQPSTFMVDAQGGAHPSERTGPDSHLSLTIPSTQQNPPSAAQGAGFGSPVPMFYRLGKGFSAPEVGQPMAGQRLPQIQHPAQNGNPQGTMLPRHAQAGAVGKRPTAQLTIFYSGMVNVYDDIPIDKAQAIMLLAGSGSSWSSSYMNPPSSGVSRPVSAPLAVPSSSAAPVTTAAQTGNTPLAGPAPPLIPAIVVNALRQPVARNLLTELPQARKASLARFLEKRKDRVRGKAPYPFIKKEGSTTPPRDKSPSPPRTTTPTRSPSPSRTQGSQQQQFSSPTRGHQPCTSSGSEPNSPTRPPRTPPLKSISEEKSAATVGGRDFERERGHASMDQRSRSPSTMSPREDRTEAMDEDPATSPIRTR